MAGVAIGATPGLAAWSLRKGAPTLLRDRVEHSHGARSGEVTTSSAVLWARAGADGRLDARISSNGRLLREIEGVWADERTDHTARLLLDGLTPGLLEGALDELPALRFLVENGTYRRGTSVFPSLTPVCLSSIATGAYPDVHEIPHLVWYHRGEGRLVEYGSSFAAIRTTAPAASTTASSGRG